MFDFPSSPTLNQTYTAHGVTYTYNGVGWVSFGTTVITASDAAPTVPDNSLWYETDSSVLWLRFNDGNSTQWVQISGPPVPSTNLYLPLSGGNLSGGIAIQPGSGWASIDLKKSGSGQANVIAGWTGSSYRWWLYLGDNVAESGGNVGSDFVVARFTDAGSVIDYPLRITRSTGDITVLRELTSNFALSVKPTSGGGVLTLQKVAASDEIYIYGMRGNTARWRINLADANPESGGNAGSNFSIMRFSDAGASIETAFSINRATGWVTIPKPTVHLENGFSTASGQVDNAGLKTQGSYGGGIIMMDGTGRCGMWCDATGANFRFGVGNATALTQCAYFTSGATYNASGAWISYSDASLKENVQTYTRGLADLVQLRPVTFAFAKGTTFSDPDETPRIGLIAQEVEPYVPEIVGEVEATIFEEPRPVKTLESGSLIFAMLNALREIDVRLRNLEAKL